jgi:hypothetical protein
VITPTLPLVSTMMCSNAVMVHPRVISEECAF